jgi:hypothetical protein
MSALETALGSKATVQYAIDDTITRFYDLSPAYLFYEEKESWHQQVAKFRQSIHFDKMANGFSERYFSPSFLVAIDQETKNTVVEDIFGFLCTLPSIQLEIEEQHYKMTDLDLRSFFSCHELKTLAASDRAEDYFSKGPGNNRIGIQVSIASTLLADFINHTDQFISTGKEPAFFRFGHAETVSPFATLLGLEGTVTEDLPLKKVSKKWKTENIIPLSANIQWVLYKSPSTDRLLVKVLLNEKETRVVGLQPFQFPYYDWKDLRAHYVKILSTQPLSLHDNFALFLRTLQ